MNRVQSYIISILFVVVISLPLLNYVVPIVKETDVSRENRNKAIFPKLNISHLDPFPRKFEQYYNDNFYFRNELLSLNTELTYRLFKESPHSSVVLGKKGWMFTRNYINSYTSKKLFTVEELNKIREMYQERASWLSSRGIKNYFVIVPTKYNVYSEYLPKSVFKYNEVTQKQQFMAAIDSIENLKIIDLEPYLLEQKEKSNIRLYHKTDQHWNHYGALLAYMKIIDEIRKDFPVVESVDLGDFKIDSAVIDGKSLAKTISVEEEVKETDYTVTLTNAKSKRKKTSVKYEVPEKFPYKTSFFIKYISTNENLPKVMLVRDSYSNALLKLLPESFYETVYIWDNWCYRLNEEIVKDEIPDIYITIVIESNLEYILYGHPSER